MPDIFLYQSEANVYTLVLSDPTTSHSGSSIEVSATGNAASFFLGIVSASTGISVSPSGNIITSASGRIAALATKPKITYGRSSFDAGRKRKRKLWEMFSL
jgi:hypothetical protein